MELLQDDKKDDKKDDKNDDKKDDEDEKSSYMDDDVVDLPKFIKEKNQWVRSTCTCHLSCCVRSYNPSISQKNRAIFVYLFMCGLSIPLTI